MSEQDDRQTSTLQVLSQATQRLGKRFGKHKASRGVSKKRQGELTQRRAITPNFEKGIYPFKGMKLSRADVEWLLATHESKKMLGPVVGPVDLNDEKQREGLDLRGADLRGADLRELPLACTHGGLIPDEWKYLSPEQRDMAAVHLEGAHLERAHLEGAKLGRAYLGGANLFSAYLQQTILHGAHLEGVNLYGAHLEGADLRRAFFDTTTVLERAALSSTKGSVKLADVRWNSVNLAVVEWKQGKTGVSGKQENYLTLGDESRLHDPKEREVGKRLHYFNAAIRANNQVSIALRAQGLNDEAAYYSYRAQKLRRKALWWQVLKGAVDTEYMPKNENEQEKKDAVPLGLWQRGQKLAAFAFSGFLAVLSGYGYKPQRCFYWYVIVVLSFALLHLHGANINEFINSIPMSISMSIQAFHGRPFSSFSLIPSPSNPYTVLDIFEAFLGLLIEALIVAIFTQRILGR